MSLSLSRSGALLACAALALTGLLTGKKGLVPVGAVFGYACAWYSHFFIEGNKPATFGHPLYSFAADWVMISKMVRGTMDAEVERFTSQTVAVSAAQPEAVIVCVPTLRPVVLKAAPEPITPSRLELQLSDAARLPSSVSVAVPPKLTVAPWL